MRFLSFILMGTISITLLSSCISTAIDATTGVAGLAVKSTWAVTKGTAKGIGYVGKAVIPGGKETNEKASDE